MNSASCGMNESIVDGQRGALRFSQDFNSRHPPFNICNSGIKWRTRCAVLEILGYSTHRIASSFAQTARSGLY